MDLALPAEVQGQLQAFEGALSGLESKLQQFLGPDAADSIAQLEPLERARVQLALAGAAAALLQLLLQTRGVDPADHESRKEQDRLALYRKKVGKVAAEKELKESKRSLEVNVAAVNRFISAAVPDLSAGQKAALKAAGGKRKGGGGGGEGEGEAAQAAAAFLQEAMAELQPAEQAAGGGGKKKKQRGGA